MTEQEVKELMGKLNSGNSAVDKNCVKMLQQVLDGIESGETQPANSLTAEPDSNPETAVMWHCLIALFNQK